MASKGNPTEQRGRHGAVVHLLAALALAALAVGLYARSVDGPFVFDDPNAVTQSELIRTVLPLSRFAVFSNRPLTDLSYALDYALGELHPRPYHATNVLLHAINAVLAYLLAWQTLGLPAMAARYANRRAVIAWAAAAAFAAHPLATETVAYVSSRSEALVACFFLLTLVLYVTAATSERRSARITAALAIPAGTAAGLASKEIAATIPPVLLLYDWCFLARGDWRRTRPRWWLVAAALLPLTAGGLFLIYRTYTSPTGLGSYGATAGLGFERFSRGEYLMTQFGVVTHYLRLLAVPVGLNFDYDWPLATSPWAPGVLLPLAALVALLAFALRRVRSQPAFTFAVLAMFLILAPTSSVLPIADLAVERRMYLPLFGWALCAATAAWDLTGRGRPRRSQAERTKIFTAIVAVPLVWFAVLTAARAALWADPVALHLDGVAKAPGNPRVRLNLGVTYLNLGRTAEAEQELREAKRLYDLGKSVHAFRRIGAFIHYNLGAVLYLRQQPAPAAGELARALELGGEYLALRPMALYILARIAVQQREWDTAIARYEEAIRFNANNPVWYLELAGAQLNNGQTARARQTLRRALERHPRNQEVAALLKELQAQSGPR